MPMVRNQIVDLWLVNCLIYVITTWVIAESLIKIGDHFRTFDEIHELMFEDSKKRQKCY